ncbi:MAG TPA: PAS domain S-box protein, partial [Patescibacteria group bacterium]
MVDTLASTSLVSVFQTLVEKMPYGFAYHKIVLDTNNNPIDYIFLEINKKFEEFTGLKKENIINKKATIAIPGIEKATPNLIPIYGKTALTGEPTEIEFYFEPLKKWYRVYAFSPQKEYFIAIFQDISIEKQIQLQSQITSRALRAISSCNQVIIKATDEKELLQNICKIITETTGYRMVWIGYAQQNEEKSVVPMAFAGFEDGYLKDIHISWGDNEYGQGPSGIAIRTEKQAIMQDMTNNPSFKPWKEEALKRGYASSVCFPLKADGTIGCICMYSSDKNAFNDPEVKLLAELAADLAFGITDLRIKIQEKEAKNYVLKSKEQLQKILASISDGFFTLDKDFRYTYINDQAAIMVGKNNAKDLQGKLLFEEFPQAIGSAYDKMYHDAMNNRKVIHFEEYFEPLKKWHQGTVYPYPGGISVFFQEITEQKKMQEELKKVSAYNRNLLEISPDPLVTISSDGKITDVNSATEKITGIERKELIGTNFSNYFTEPQKAEEGYQQVFKQGFVRDYPLQIKRKDGNTTPVLYNASVYKDEKGNIAGVFAAARDISQLEKIQTALSQTEERYKAYVENSNDVMYALDPNGLILYLSPQCRRFGLDPDALINKKTLKEIFPPEQGTELTKEFEKILISQHQGFVTFAYKDADERLFWLEASGTVQRDSKGNPIGAIGII